MGTLMDNILVYNSLTGQLVWLRDSANINIFRVEYSKYNNSGYEKKTNQQKFFKQ